MPAKPLILLCLLLAGCNPASPTTPSGIPDVEGVILDLLPDHTALIEATFRARQYPDTFFVNPWSEVFLHRADGTLQTADKTDLRVGDHLRAWLMDVELRSLPPQYPARVVEVLRPDL